MRAHSTTVDPKCDILPIPDGVLGAGEAMRRREFIAFVGSTAVAWPLTARAQQPATPIVGFLHVAANNAFPVFVAAFREGLKENGYVESQNVAIEYRWAEGQFDRLPGLAADLVQRKVAVIATFGGVASALAAKAATTTIPIVFNVGGDPVKLGLVASLNRPGGNATGVNQFLDELAGKRLGLLHDLAPSASVVALLVNPAGPNAATNIAETEAAARTLGLRIEQLSASDEHGIDAAFASMSQTGASALLVGADVYFNSRRDQIVKLASEAAIPALYEERDFAVAGGLMSYGTNLRDVYHQQGVYVGRVLKGEKPADLPVIQPTKFYLVINLKTAKVLGISIPPGVLAIADEVIE
jgi:putative tryptophan/tyrosine transport system substrate-binding protein